MILKQVFRRMPILAAAILILWFNGCLYTNVKLPLDTNVSETRLGTKIGKASMRSYLFLYATGDASVEAAARDGGINTIQHLDSQQKIVLFGLYAKRTTIAYGD